MNYVQLGTRIIKLNFHYYLFPKSNTVIAYIIYQWESIVEAYYRWDTNIIFWILYSFMETIEYELWHLSDFIYVLENIFKF